MASTFFSRIEELKARVGSGDLKGTVTVDQHYALEQHENTTYEHPRGGGPFFLASPLMQQHIAYMAAIAATVLEDGGEAAMIDAMEDLSDRLDPAAPIDEDPNPIRLRRSGNPKVVSGGEVVYDRPSVDPREPFLDPDDEARANAAESRYSTPGGF